MKQITSTVPTKTTIFPKEQEKKKGTVLPTKYCACWFYMNIGQSERFFFLVLRLLQSSQEGETRGCID